MINKSKTYLLPLLSELVDLDKRFYKDLKNTYIFDDKKEYENCIFLLYDFSFKNPEFTAYEHKLINNELYVDLIDVGDQVLYVFKFPDVYLHEYKMFKAGKYSYYKDDAKKLILRFFNNIYQNNLNAVSFLTKIKQILFKNEKLKKEIEEKLKIKLSPDAELTDIIEVDNETFNLQKKEKQEQNKK